MRDNAFVIAAGAREIREVCRLVPALVAVVTTAVLIALFGAAPAQARLAFTPAETLSEPAAEYGPYAPQVAVDDSGDATVVWFRDSSLEFAQIAPDGTAGPVQVLADGLGYYPGPRLVMDADGRATVLWTTSYGSTESFVKAARIETDGTVGPTLTLSGPNVTGNSVSAVVDDAGAVTAVWAEDDYTPPDYRGSIEMGGIDAAGNVVPQHTISEYGDGYPRLALAPSGAAMVTWGRVLRVLAVRVSPAGTPGPLITLDEGSVGSPTVVADSTGRFTVAWAAHWDGAIKAARYEADGTAEPVREIENGATSPVATASILIDGDDRLSLIWARCPTGCSGRFNQPRYGVFGTHLDADLESGEVLRLSGDEPADRPPTATVGADGQIIAAWPAKSRAGIDAAWLPLEGAPGPVTPVSRPSRTQTAEPGVAVAPDGQATVAWVNSGKKQIEFSRSYEDNVLKGSAAAKKKQGLRHRRIRVKVTARAAELLKVKAKGKLRVRGQAYNLRSRPKLVEAGEKARLWLKVKRDRRRLAGKIRNGRTGRAKIDVTLTDRAGNERAEQLKVKVVR